MLENVNLERELSKGEYNAALPRLQRRLYDLEKACWDNGVPSLVVFEGWETSGKGGAIATLTERLDPRGFRMYSITPPRTHENQFPWLRRFWLKTPNRGEMAIFDRSWYRRVLEKRVDRIIPPEQWKQAYQDIVEFERMLADDGVVLVKLFFHISKKEQGRRFKKILADPLEKWRISQEDLEHSKQYDEFSEAVEDMLERTEAAHASWTIVEATCKRWARKKVFDTIIHALSKRLGPLAPPEQLTEAQAGHDAELRSAMQKIKRSVRRRSHAQEA
jgi:polyphosphate kinase 2 (PPK2 family)